MAARGLLIALLMLAALAACAGAASAQVDLVSSDTVHGVADLRLSGADGEPSFTDGGFGKSRYGAGGGGYQGRIEVAEAALEWTPRLDWAWSAVVDAGYQPDQEHPVDLYQAYVVFKPVPNSDTRFSARFGYFYPPISLEHDARVWGVTDTITPSAIDSWVGEEVKVVGAEATLSRDFGGSSLALTGALFGFDDTAGTLIAYRGWALDDLKSQAFGSFELPPLAPDIEDDQDSETYSSREIDKRPGFYAKLQWRPAAPVMIEALYYDNRGDGVSVTGDQQWAWATHFADLGASVQLDDRTRILAQALAGRTGIGPPAWRYVDVVFGSAYALITRDVGKGAVTARADVFETADHAPAPPAPDGEHGWALTGAWRYPLTDGLDLRLEAMHVESTRPSRILAGEAPFQRQTVLQSSLRFSF
jgi:hypothetical protein